MFNATSVASADLKTQLSNNVTHEFPQKSVKLFHAYAVTATLLNPVLKMWVGFGRAD